MEEIDLDAIMEIESSVYPEHHWSKEGFYNEINSELGHYFSLVLDNKVIGYGGFWGILDEGHITTIAIHKDYQHQGFAEAIILALAIAGGYILAFYAIGGGIA